LTPIFDFIRWITTGNKYILDVRSLKGDLETRVFAPWLEQLETRAKRIVTGTVSLYSEHAIYRIKDVLETGRLRYEREGELRRSSEQTRRQPHAVALTANLWAIKGALEELENASKELENASGVIH
jgi:hypothetical protein